MQSSHSSKQRRDSDSPTGSIPDSSGRPCAKQQRRPMIQKEQTDLIGWMEDRQLVLYVQEHGISSNIESQPREKHGVRASRLQAQHKSSKAVFESEPEERHDDQVAFQVKSQQCRCKGLATRDTAKRELVDASQVRLTSVLQPQFDGQYAVDDVNVGTVSSPFLQKQDLGDLSTEQMSERGGVGQVLLD